MTVPVLWDKETRRIVNNSEDDICRMFNDAFNVPGNSNVDLVPKDIEDEHAKLSAFIYDRVNNGVYKSGFASSQQAYEKLGWRRDAIYSEVASSRQTGGSSVRS